jgi:hypothetical protein
MILRPKSSNTFIFFVSQFLGIQSPQTVCLYFYFKLLFALKYFVIVECISISLEIDLILIIGCRLWGRRTL